MRWCIFMLAMFLVGLYHRPILKAVRERMSFDKEAYSSDTYSSEEEREEPEMEPTVRTERGRGVEPIVLMSSSTERRLLPSPPNHIVESTTVTTRREVYNPVWVGGHWVHDEYGNRTRYVEGHVEYR